MAKKVEMVKETANKANVMETAKEIRNYENLEVKTYPINYVKDGVLRYSYAIHPQFNGLIDQIDYENLEKNPISGSNGIMITNVRNIDFYSIFMNGIENVMILGNKFEKMKFLNILYKYCKTTDYMSRDYEKFLSFVCELGMYGFTRGGVQTANKFTFSEHFKRMINEYNEYTGIGSCSATRFNA